jgi:hypothetical protein
LSRVPAILTPQQKSWCVSRLAKKNLVTAVKLWNVFGLAAKAAHKNQSTELVLTFSYRKQPSPETCKPFAYEAKKLELLQALKQEDDSV